RTRTGQRPNARLAAFETNEKLRRRTEQLAERRIDVKHIGRWIGAPQRAIEIERRPVELRSEPNAELQLIHVAVVDVAFYALGELEVAVASNRLRHGALRADRLRRYGGDAKEPFDVTIDAFFGRAA